jgi:hypothetical protein
MKVRQLCVSLFGAAVVCALTVRVPAAIIYSANFDNAADITTWTVNKAPTANAANQGAITGFDYSAFGIPAAPGNAANDTFGMRLRANVPGGDATPTTARPVQTTSGLSVSPTGQNFGANYEVQFYAWSNFNGAANASGLADNANSQGGTNNVMMAIGTSGTTPLVVGNTTLVTNASMDGVGFATTGDGGIVDDYRAYLTSGTFTPTSSGIYAAGSTSNTNAYYTGAFGTHTAPTAQLAISTAEFNDGANNTQAGSTQAGAFGFAWHKVIMAKEGNTAYWYIDGYQIVKADISSLTLGGNNLALGQSDINTSTTRHPSLLFTVFDNLTVSDTITVPEPASFSLLGIGLGGAALAVRRKRSAK